MLSIPSTSRKFGYCPVATDDGGGSVKQSKHWDILSSGFHSKCSRLYQIVEYLFTIFALLCAFWSRQWHFVRWVHFVYFAPTHHSRQHHTEHKHVAWVRSRAGQSKTMTMDASFYNPMTKTPFILSAKHLAITILSIGRALRTVRVWISMVIGNECRSLADLSSA